MPINNTNPNSYGGSFNYDGRTGLGYGQLGNNPNSGLGSNWNMGDALSSPKGEWDDVEYDEDVKDCGCRIEINCDCDEFEIGIELKSPTSGLAFNQDAGSGKSRRNPNSYVGLANTSAYLGASHKRSEDVLREYISEALNDILYEAPHMGGMTAVRRSGNSKMYKPDTANSVSGYGMGGKGTYGIDHGGYGQNGIEDDPSLEPYVKGGKATTDGAETVYYSDIDTDWEEDLSTGESLFNSFDPEIEFSISFKKHGNKNKYY